MEALKAAAQEEPSNEKLDPKIIKQKKVKYQMIFFIDSFIFVVG